MLQPADSDCCFHCGQPLDSKHRYETHILGEARPMCCPGCQYVSQAIVDSGLDDYYRFRTEMAEKGDEQLDATLEQLTTYDDKSLQEEFVASHDNYDEIQLTIEGISCAACGWLIEKQLASLSGLKQVAVNVAARRATISWYPEKLKLSDIMRRIERIGYHALPFQMEQHEASYQREHKQFLKKLGLSGLMTMQVMMLAIGLYFSLFGYISPQTERYFHWVSLLLSTPVVVYAGSGFYASAWHALRAGTANMDVSITLAIWGTFASSAWATVTASGDIYFESVCMFIFLLLISRYLEHASRHKASQISSNMMKYIPVSATRWENDQWTPCLAKKLEPGDLIQVKTGEVIPVDGVIKTGETTLEESMLTGEFEPVHKAPGETVYGGTVNRSQPITVEVTATFQHALVNEILRMQELALASKPAISHFADRASRSFVFVVILIAAGAYLAWQWIDPSRAYWVAIAVLVATCPCALGLATPSALTSAIARLNKQGLLVKRADVLEQLVDVNRVVLDKTGTLTEGRFSLTRIFHDAALEQEQILLLAASIEAHSEHPVAAAFCVDKPLLSVNQVTVRPGQGLSAEYEQKQYRIGSAEFMQTAIPQAWQSARVFLSCNGRILAGFELDDTLRADAALLIKALQSLQPTMVTGDSEQRANAIATSLGIEHVEAEKQPKDKLDLISDMQKHGETVLVLGDGINDAPVLAQADVSVAIGSGSDMAKRSADVVLLNNRLTHIAQLFQIATRCRQIIRQNMYWAFGYNLVILPLALAGWLTPWMAVIGMSASSIIVVSNSLRLLRDDANTSTGVDHSNPQVSPT